MNAKRSLALAIALCSLIAILGFTPAASARTRVSIGIGLGFPAYYGPPAPYRDRVYARPGLDYVWIGGYWGWGPAYRNYYWVPGQWVLPSYYDSYWVAPRYDGGYYYRGYWSRGGRGYDRYSYRGHDSYRGRDGYSYRGYDGYRGRDGYNGYSNR